MRRFAWLALLFFVVGCGSTDSLLNPAGPSQTTSVTQETPVSPASPAPPPVVPTGPESSPTPPSSPAPVPVPPPTSPGPCPADLTHEDYLKFTSDGSISNTGATRWHNVGGCIGHYVVVIYNVAKNNFYDQSTLSAVDVLVRPGEWGNSLMPIPPAGCNWQGDVYGGDGITAEKVLSGKLKLNPKYEKDPDFTWAIFGQYYTTQGAGCAPPPPPPTCKDFQPPVLKIFGEPLVEYTSTQITVSQGTIGPAGVTYFPPLPLKGDRPEYDAKQEIFWSFTSRYAEPYGPPELKCVVEVTKDFKGVIKPKEPPTCKDFQPPVLKIFGEPLVEYTSTQITVSQGTIGPAGVTFFPPLPLKGDRPEYDAKQEIFWLIIANYEEFYGPPELKCKVKVEKFFSDKIKPKEPPTCKTDSCK